MVRWDGQYSDRLLEIIDWCLNLNHLYRPQSVFALQKALVEEITPPPKEKHRDGLTASSAKSREQRNDEIHHLSGVAPGGRANNEDRVAYCYSRDALLMVVADGMGALLR